MTDILDDLAALDVADSTLDGDQRARADTLLARIVAADPVPAPTRPRRRPRLVGRAAAGLVAATVVGTAAAVLLPTAGDSGAAYASWTPRPARVVPPDLAAVTEACRDQLGQGGTGNGADMQSIPVQLAERRGEFVFVLLYQADPETSATCLARNPAGSGDVSEVNSGIGGSDGPALAAPAGRITQGSVTQFARPALASATEGRAGDGVVGVTIHAAGLVVEASVTGDRYAAWWPGSAFADAPAQPDGPGGPELMLTYDVTLADGTTQRDVQPALPH